MNWKNSTRLAFTFAVLFILFIAIFAINRFVYHINAQYQKDVSLAEQFLSGFNRMQQEYAQFLVDFSVEHKSLFKVYRVDTQKYLVELKKMNIYRSNKQVRRNIEGVALQLNSFYQASDAQISDVEKSGIQILYAFQSENIRSSDKKFQALQKKAELSKKGVEAINAVTNVRKNISSVMDVLENEKRDLDRLTNFLSNVVSVFIFCAIIVISISTLYGFRRSERELLKLQNYLSNIIDSMPSILVGVEPDGTVTQWNKKAEEFTGISVGNALGQSITSLMLEVKLEMEHIRESIESKEIKKFSGIATLRRDSTVYEDITVYPLVTNGAGGAVIRIDDVTKEYLLQEQLNQNRKMEAIGQLAGSIAHDFNNMLSGIMGSAEVLQSSKHNLDDEGLEFVDMILEASRQAADLTAKLLAFGRKGAILDNALDIHALIDDTHAIFKRTIDKKIKTSIAKNAENSTVMGDNSSLQNVLLNLVINASHAMPDGGELKIETRNLNLDEYYCNTSPFDIKAGDYIEIEVRDNGCGIPQENLHKIFDPFFTTKEYGKGTGLGLASVYGTIQDHHGVVNVYSEVGTGTVFHLFLPCSEQTVKIPDRREVVLKGTGQGLLVDDEEIIRKTGKRLLEEMGYKINLAKNGTEAVAMFAANYSEIDFVIMDMIMPEMNGSEAFYKMKEIDNDCIVIISSGFLKDENLNELKDAGLAGFIQKPFRDYELSKLLSRVLGKEPV